MDLDDLFKVFLSIKTAEGRAKSTIQQYKDNYKYFTAFLEKQNIEKSLNELNRTIFRKYITYMREEVTKFEDHKYKTETQRTKGLSPLTINTRLKTLRVMFQCLFEEEIISFNPILGVKNVPNPQENIEILTIEELRSLLKSPNKSTYAGFRDHTLMHVLIDGMSRISESIKLKESDFDFKHNTATIRASVAKNRKSRTLPLKPLTMRLVRKLIDTNSDFSTEYVFLTNYGEPISRDHFRKRLYEYADQAKIKKKVHPHLLRHSAATAFLEDGGDIRHLQMLLGHSDLRMVVRYTHLSNKALQNQHAKHSAINKVANKLSRPRKTKL
ncbi:hypothetical protein M948_19435 [Virgibacillus sp. CM-4]|uniref:tyrosine-type recombinase/integrase n=1 Tax=Virgibacillus sp. CM-4 TaxID=1354277 RepID=UPI0003886F6D|nr:tyrosine-type recombinase/integrase [Virgibacillus sp. CM-4]EQB35274.1 hypothetical protein M948_19435 [Virgibacillus sp. CM-4]